MDFRTQSLANLFFRAKSLHQKIGHILMGAKVRLLILGNSREGENNWKKLCVSSSFETFIFHSIFTPILPRSFTTASTCPSSTRRNRNKREKKNLRSTSFSCFSFNKLIFGLEVFNWKDKIKKKKLTKLPRKLILNRKKIFLRPMLF